MLSFKCSTHDYPTEIEIIAFEGQEGISQDYSFSIIFKVNNAVPFSPSSLLKEPAKLSLETERDSHDIQGVITCINEAFTDDPHYRTFTATLESVLTTHGKNISNNIFIDQQPTDTLCNILDTDLDVTYFQSTTQNYPIKSFYHQYKESNFHYFSRLCEHWGIYYYFDRLNNNTLVFADDLSCLDLETTYLYKENPLPAEKNICVSQLNHVFSNPVDGVKIEGRNPEFASQIINGQAGDISDINKTIHLNSTGIDNNEEADFIAKMRLEQAVSQTEIYTGSGSAIGLIPGFVMHLKLANKPETLKLLITEVTHKGANLDASQDELNSDYECTFTAIPADTQYRPEIKTDIPTAISSTARVHSDFDNKTLAHRDELGRYKVIFDYLGDSKVSHWIRKAQTSAKENHVDIPLLANTEVQIGYLGGNPDLPYIISAIENSESPIIPGNQDTPYTATLSTCGMLHLEASRSITHSFSAPMTKSKKKNPSGGGSGAPKKSPIADVKNYFKLDNTGVRHIDDNGHPEALSLNNTNYNISSEEGQYYKVLDTIYFYLGDNRRYHFGNQYRELHAKNKAAKDVDTDDTYVFTSTTLLDEDENQATNPDINSDMQAGLVRKIFGNRYNYHDGHSVNIRNCSSGIPKTFNHGARYVENIPNDQTTHTGSIVKGFPEGHQPTNNDYVVRNRIKLYKINEADTCFVQNGNRFTQLTGDTERIYNGSRSLTIKGDTVKRDIHLTGDSTKKITAEGKMERTYKTSNLNSTLHGNRQNHIFGSDNVLIAGIKNSMVIGPVASIEAVTSLKMVGGLKFEAIMGPSIKYMAAPEFKKGPGKNDEYLFTREDIKLKLEQFGTKLGDAKTCIERNAVSITNSALTMIG